jgi:hypothetical protein
MANSLGSQMDTDDVLDGFQEVNTKKVEMLIKGLQCHFVSESISKELYRALSNIVSIYPNLPNREIAVQYLDLYSEDL